MWRDGMEGRALCPPPTGRKVPPMADVARLGSSRTAMGFFGSLFCTLGFTKRSCQRSNTVLDTPASRMIACVHSPSSLSSMIPARQTCFCDVFRSATRA